MYNSPMNQPNFKHPLFAFSQRKGVFLTWQVNFCIHQFLWAKSPKVEHGSPKNGTLGWKILNMETIFLRFHVELKIYGSYFSKLYTRFVMEARHDDFQ